MTADRIVEALERRAAVLNDRFAGMTADNIERALEREAAQSSAEAHGGR